MKLAAYFITTPGKVEQLSLVQLHVSLIRTTPNKLAHHLTSLSCHDCPCSPEQPEWLARTTALIRHQLSSPADIGQMYVHTYMYMCTCTFITGTCTLYMYTALYKADS